MVTTRQETRVPPVAFSDFGRESKKETQRHDDGALPNAVCFSVVRKRKADNTRGNLAAPCPSRSSLTLTSSKSYSTKWQKPHIILTLAVNSIGVASAVHK